MIGRRLLALVLVGGLAGGLAVAQGRSSASEAAALALAKIQAEQAERRSKQLEREADRATGEAAKARAEAAAVAARIQAAEADITAGETRIRIIENLRAAQRARLAERQEPVVRLTAALQTMARRPAALALVQPGSLDDVVHVRSLLASTLPIIRERTSGLRAEIEAGTRLRRQAEIAVGALLRSQEALKRERIAFARLEAQQRLRSRSLAESALSESDRALALGEEARDLAALMGTLEYQRQVRERLAELPGPIPRPPLPGAPAAPLIEAARGPSPPRYLIPVEGVVVVGMGEISDAGVHARGLTFETRPRAQAVAPKAGRVAYAGRFRGYGDIVIIEHGGGWTSLVTNLEGLSVKLGDEVAQGSPIGRAGSGRRPRVTVELRRNGRPFPIAPLAASG